MDKILKTLDQLAVMSKANDESSVELQSILTKANLHHNLRFNPRAVKLTDYMAMSDALHEYQDEYQVDIGSYISVIDDYIQDKINAGVSVKGGTVDLSVLRKNYTGRKIDIKQLNGVENIAISDGILSFYFYIQEAFNEFRCDVSIQLEDDKIIKIMPMKEYVLISESDRRTTYKPVKTKTSHYGELDAIFRRACS